MAALERVEPGKRSSSKRHIMACALACFDEMGLEATKIDDIRQRAESSIGSIYHHFGNKEGLVAALYFAALDDQLALMQPRILAASTPREAVEALIRSYLGWVEQQPELARFLFQARHAVASGPRKDDLTERNQRRYGALLEWLAKGVEAGVIRRLPRELYASLLIGQAENYCRAWLSGRVKGAPTVHADIFADAAWRSVAEAVSR
ncbi:TetR/AcrR family transcriptional regulator [Pseudomonas benzenivorans]|uniref:TetR/AcrR family transcriptional regulator n=1 Tax=Pseudomonas benzenivorans TaxID=556533 RepID=UPI002105C069|nr:TetR/AcrR family transcriptional regulator [Pseudomonas benzenivorans]